MRFGLVVALGLALGLPAAATARVTGAFKTPSGNIICGYDYAPGFSSIGCGIKSGLKPPIPPPAGGCIAGDYSSKRISLNKTGRARPTVCAGDPGPFLVEDRATVLGYGKTWMGRGVWCISMPAGLTCGNRSGHGFFMSRTRWRLY